MIFWPNPHFKWTYRPVLAVAFTADGQTIVSAGEDDTISIWSLADLDQPPILFLGHTNDVLALIITPDGQLISSSLDNTVRSWDLPNLRAEPTTLLEQERPVLGMALSGDGQTLALGGDDGTVQLYDLDNNAATIIGRHESSVIGVAFSPDQTRVASTGVDNTVQVWNLTEPGSPPWCFRAQFPRAGGPVSARSATGSFWGDDKALIVWDLANPTNEGLFCPAMSRACVPLPLSPDGCLWPRPTMIGRFVCGELILCPPPTVC
ncbi:MAG: hypothetical protein IPL78_27050 [Chloroflexi bacterium]|nr:hypothetical protein [Chloroflexota bacterium]